MWNFLMFCLRIPRLLCRRGFVKLADVSCMRRGCIVCGVKGGKEMTLMELSREYEAAAVPLRARLKELRMLLAAAEDPEDIFHIKRRIGELTPMLTQMNELAELTAHYYDRGYWRNGKYTV